MQLIAATVAETVAAIATTAPCTQQQVESTSKFQFIFDNFRTALLLYAALPVAVNYLYGNDVTAMTYVTVTAMTYVNKAKQDVKVIRQKAPHGGPFPG